MPPLFILLFLSWDLITLDSLLGHDHSLTHHNILSFKAVTFISSHCWLLPWAMMFHGIPLLTGIVPFKVCCAPEKYTCVQRLTVVVSYLLKNKLIIQKDTFLNLWYNEQKLITANEMAPSANNFIFLLQCKKKKKTNQTKLFNLWNISYICWEELREILYPRQQYPWNCFQEGLLFRVALYLLNRNQLILKKGSSSDLSSPFPPHNCATTGEKTTESSDTSEKCWKSKL